MFVEAIPRAIQSNLALIGTTPLPGRFYLAGGTAITLHLGHRRSYDLDFFTEQEFDHDLLRRALSPLGDLAVDHESADAFFGFFNGVRTSFLLYPYPLLAPCVEYEKVRIAGLPDLAAMKMDIISQQGRKRDFVDLYFICQRAFPLARVISLFEQKLAGIRYNSVHLLKSLVDFVDADEDEMPRMLQEVSWETVKKFFEGEVQRMYEAQVARTVTVQGGQK